MNVFRKVDLWLVEEVFEPVSWRIEAKTERNNFFVARCLLVVSIAAFLVLTVDLFQESPMDAGLLLPITCVAAIAIYTITVSQEKNSKTGFYNAEKSFGPAIVLRWASSIIVLLTIRDIFEDVPFVIGMLCYWLYLYFCACNPMPPGYKDELEDKDKRFVPSKT